MAPGTVTFVVFENFDTVDLAGPVEVFGEAGYDLRIVAPAKGPVTSDAGLSVNPDHSVRTADPRDVDTLLVVGGAGVHAAQQDTRLVRWVADAAASAGRVASVCSGTFLLAEAGVLDGHRVTTHWRKADRLAAEYPAITVDSDPIFIREGRIWTSAGVSAGMDLALAMVEDDLGPHASLAAARELNLFLRRPGSQSQFSVPLWSTPPRDDIMRRVVDAIHANPGDPHGIADLANVAGLSPRHLQRRFTQEVGMTPAAYVERVRVEAAQRDLSERDDPVEAIAHRHGFGTAETLRRTFHRVVGTSPTDYRARFTTTAAPTPPTPAHG
ncbi:GlxA family transcriptional regulator [Jiangella sp. DSM 45060]|uniref:GlxA family transcriptional regulator n=1 Tax=Jiangella sp. DSM 45060 TaxID=1798224 RepID=UPI00087A6FA4|nr:GlxA family transcriptional regulator [Jiangella sp. DSM 45060]SDT61745.1 Transcriptional regulator GlxA family, contains an amidase domain and an AraC-type DNA-binding HTH domain [Jiangella sp. DSM 45060]